MNMKASRKFKDMTPEEKRKSLELWHKFYDFQLRNDFIESWQYWTQRMEYLQKIGVDFSEDKSNKMWMNKVTAEV
jgi:hypothetical protein